MIVGILVGVVFLAIIIIFAKSRANKSSGASYDSVLKNSYPNLSYKEVFRLGYDNAEHLLRSMPCVCFDTVELLAFLNNIARTTVIATGGNVREWGNESSEFIRTKLPEGQRKHYFDRYSFYLGISGGEKVEAVWSFSPIPPAVLSVPMLRAAVAFGDCITNPSLIEDYEDGAISLYDFDAQAQFQQRFSDEFMRLVHTFCVMVAGREFDPPILSPDEIET